MSFVNENIKVLRNQMGLTQEGFAELSGINRKVIGSYEEGRATPPLENLNKFAKIFEISIDQLISHRFALDTTPLFKEEEPEKKLTTSGNRKTANKQFLKEKEADFSFTPIPYISHKYFDKYILDASFSERINQMPVFTLPFELGEGNFRAFDIPAESDYANGVVIVKEADLSSPAGKYFIIISTHQGVLLRKIHTGGEAIEVSSLKMGKEVINSANVKEVWEVIAFYSNMLPSQQPDLGHLRSKISSLKEELDKLL